MIFLNNKIKSKYLILALEVYNYYIEHSSSNFEEKKLSVNSFKSLYMKCKQNKLPFVIAVDNDQVIGLAFVNKFREKSGYRFTYEHSIYVSQKFRNNGYGSIILKELISLCKNNKNIKNLIAVIGGSDNISSVKIHKKSGFKYIGTLTRVGFKKNKWIDSIYMQKIL